MLSFLITRGRIMLSIEEIKKACVFADGFEYLDYDSLCDYIEFDEDYGTIDIYTFMDHKIFYSLFLQRVIEGINNSNTRFIIDTTQHEYNINDTNGNDDRYGVSLKTRDESKEFCIKYILGKL